MVFLRVRPGGDCFVASFLAMTPLRCAGASPPDPKLLERGQCSEYVLHNFHSANGPMAAVVSLVLSNTLFAMLSKSSLLTLSTAFIISSMGIILSK